MALQYFYTSGRIADLMGVSLSTAIRLTDRAEIPLRGYLNERTRLYSEQDVVDFKQRKEALKKHTPIASRQMFNPKGGDIVKEEAIPVKPAQNREE